MACGALAQVAVGQVVSLICGDGTDSRGLIQNESRFTTQAVFPLTAGIPNVCVVGGAMPGRNPEDPEGGFMAVLRFDVSDTPPSFNVIGAFRMERSIIAVDWTNFTEKARPAHHQVGSLGAVDAGGFLHMWSAEVIGPSGASSPPKLVTQSILDCPCTALAFGSPRSDLGAVAGVCGGRGEILIVKVDADLKVESYEPIDDITTLTNATPQLRAQWNPKTHYVLASLSANSEVLIWDMKTRTVSRLRESTQRYKPMALAWMPNGVQLLAGFDDDVNYWIQVWDLRNTSSPTKMDAHQRGTLEIAFSPADSNIFVTWGRDGRLLCHCATQAVGKPTTLGELPAPPTASSSRAGGMSQRPGQASPPTVRISWAPHAAGLFVTTSIDWMALETLNYMRPFVASQAIATKFLPRWMQRPGSCVTAGFGGKLVTTSRSEICLKTGDISSTHSTAAQFLTTLSSSLSPEFCALKASSAEEPQKKCYNIMSQILSLSNTYESKEARAALVSLLEYDEASIRAAVETFTGGAVGTYMQTKQSMTHDNSITDGEAEEPQGFGYGSRGSFGHIEVDPEKLFQSLSEKTRAHQERQNRCRMVNGSTSAQSPPPSPTKEAEGEGENPMEQLTKRCILIGDTTAAVELCLVQGRLSDALVLAAQSGDAQLWGSVQKAYVLSNPHGLSQIIGCIMERSFERLVASSDLIQWEETLALLCTHADAARFPTLCEKLGERLESERSDLEASITCYQFARNFAEPSRIWCAEFDQTFRSASQTKYFMGLEDLVQKLIVWRDACSFQGFDAPFAGKLVHYAQLLSHAGMVQAAMHYLLLLRAPTDSFGPKSEVIAANQLRDRIFHAQPEEMRRMFGSAAVGTAPYEIENIEPSAQQMAEDEKSRHQHQPMQQQPHLPQQQQPLPTRTPPYSQLPQHYAPVPHFQQPMPQPGASPPPHHHPPAYAPKPQAAPQPPSLGHVPGPTSPLSFAPAASYSQPYGVAPQPPTQPLTPSYPMGPGAPLQWNQQSSWQQSSADRPISSPILQPSHQGMAAQAPPQPPMTYQPLPAAAASHPPLPMASASRSYDNAPPSQSSAHSSVRSGSVATAPAEGAVHLTKPGMPVPWPIPTDTQQAVYSNQNTSAANQRISGTAGTVASDAEAMSQDRAKFVTKTLNELLQRRALENPRQFETATARVQQLEEQLVNGTVSKASQEKIIAMCQAIQGGDSARAHSLIQEIVGADFGPHKHWIPVVRGLL